MGRYQHFKGEMYEVIGMVWDADVNPPEESVLYKALYCSEEFGKEALWVRSKEGFLEEVEVEGRIVPRFKYLGKMGGEG